MKNKLFNRLIKFLFILIFVNLSYSENMKWFGNLRYRTLQDKNAIENTWSSYSEMRSRLGFSFERQKIVSSFILQESKIIGEGDNFSGVTTRPLSPFFYEVSFKIKDLLSEDELYQFGRFELALGNQRIISKNNWNNVGRTFEGFLYSGDLYKKNRVNVFSLGLNEQINEENDDSKDSWLNGIYYSAAIKQLENSSLEFYYLDLKDSIDINSYATAGSRIDANLNQFNLEGEFAFQTSSNISSQLLSLNISYKPKRISLLNKISFGYDYISGDDSTTTKFEGFSKYFGARHKFHGFYDYNDHRSFMDNEHKGLNELNIKAVLDLFFDAKLFISIHNFKSNTHEKDYGNEIDFVLKKNLSNLLSFESGFIFYSPSSNENDDVLPFSYLALTAKF